MLRFHCWGWSSPITAAPADDSYQTLLFGAVGVVRSQPPEGHNHGTDAVTYLLGYLLVFLGGGLGSMLRHAVNQASAALLGVGFWGTLFVNISGSFAMGLIAGWFAFRGAGGGQWPRLFLTTGILGGFTTFSTFSLDAALFWERGQLWGTACYVGGSVAAGLMGLFGGLALVRGLTM
jgi:CrcB protein